MQQRTPRCTLLGYHRIIKPFRTDAGYTERIYRKDLRAVRMCKLSLYMHTRMHATYITHTHIQ